MSAQVLKGMFQTSLLGVLVVAFLFAAVCGFAKMILDKEVLLFGLAAVYMASVLAIIFKNKDI